MVRVGSMMTGWTDASLWNVLCGLFPEPVVRWAGRMDGPSGTSSQINSQGQVSDSGWIFLSVVVVGLAPRWPCFLPMLKEVNRELVPGQVAEKASDCLAQSVLPKPGPGKARE